MRTYYTFICTFYACFNFVPYILQKFKFIPWDGVRTRKFTTEVRKSFNINLVTLVFGEILPPRPFPSQPRDLHGELYNLTLHLQV